MNASRVQPPKPLAVHIKALAASAVLMAFALGFSWLFPHSYFTLTRMDADRVHCVVDMRLVAVIPFDQIVIEDLRGVRVMVEESNARSRDSGDLMDLVNLGLMDAAGREVFVRVNEWTANSLQQRIHAFLAESDEPKLTAWSASLFSHATLLPALLGTVFTLLILCDLAKSQWRRLTR